MFSKHAFYIIIDFYRDERCKFHIRYRDDQRIKKNKIVVNFNFVTITHFQHEFSINNDDDEIIFTFLTQQISRTKLAKLTIIRSNFAKIARRNTRVIK